MSNVSSSNSQGELVPELRFPEDKSNWNAIVFEKLFDILTNNTLSRAELSFDGKIKNIHYGDILTRYGNILDMNEECVPYININSAVKYNESYLEDGDIIIADTAEDITVGKTTEIYNLKYNLALSGLHTIPCRPKIKFEPKYLGYYMNGPQYHKQLFPLMQGIKVLSISKANISKTIIRYPSIDVQKKQTQILSLLDKKIRKQNELINCLKSYKRGLLSRLFPKKGKTVPELRLRDFTDDWEQRKVADIFKVTRGYVLAATETDEDVSEKMPYPVYSSQTKNDGLMGFYKDYLYEDAITWTTDGANAGTVSYRTGKFYCTNVCGVLLSEEGYANKMVAEALNTIAWKHVSRVGNPKLMNNVMSEIEVCIPKQVDEQRKISGLFEKLDNLITLHQQKLDMCTTVKKYLLQKMFV